MSDYAGPVSRATEPLYAQLSRLHATDPARDASNMFEILQTELHSRAGCILLFGLPVFGIREIL